MPARGAPLKRVPFRVRAQPAPDGVRVKVKKRKRADPEFLLARARVFGMTAGCCVRCGHAAHHGHHRVRQSQGGPHTVENIVPVCWECHDWIHRHRPAEARAMGLLLHRFDEITPWWELPFWTGRRAAA